MRHNLLWKLAHVGILKTLWINFYCLPFHRAVFLPIVVARSVRIDSCFRNCIKICKSVKWGGVNFGFMDIEYSYDKKSSLTIEGQLVLHGKASFAPGLSLYIAKGAIVEIGDCFSCSHNTRFTIFKGLKIGDNNMWSFDNLIMDTDAHRIFVDNELVNTNKEIVFGNKVWLGCRNVVLKGARIPDGCIIGANGYITKELPLQNSIYLNNKIVRPSVTWEWETKALNL